jgi:hypothetical protein
MPAVLALQQAARMDGVVPLGMLTRRPDEPERRRHLNSALAHRPATVGKERRQAAPLLELHAVLPLFAFAWVDTRPVGAHAGLNT